MGKLINKTFYVSDVDLKDISQNEHLDDCEDILLSTKQELHYKNQIQISWQEPERRVEISESDFDLIWNGSDEYTYYDIKKKYFGASDE